MTSPEASRPPLDRSAVAAVADYWRVEVLDEVESTNALAADRARDGAPEGLVVVAEHQTSGRGRLGRSWETPARAALTFSVLARPPVRADWWAWLSPLTGVAVVEGVRRAADLQCTLKWPNDVLADGKKLAGILLERVETPEGPAAVIGVGINVSTTEAELPVPTATSIALAGAGDVDRTAVLRAVLEDLGSAYAEWKEAGGDPGSGLRDRYVERCQTIGQVVEVKLPTGRTVIGRAGGIDDNGSLEVNGETVSAGDVVHVRPA